MELNARYSGLTVIPAILVISAFGIYLPGTPLRTDHLAVYGALLLCGLMALRDSQFRFPRVLLPVVLLWSVFLLYCLVVTGVRQEVRISKYVIGQIERWVQPVALMAIVAVVTQRYPLEAIRNATVLCSKLILWGNAFAATFALALVAGLPLRYAKLFQGAPMDAITLTDRALAMGRFTGIFSTPFEAGIVYSLSCFAFVFLIRTNRSSILYTVLTLLAVVGAFLAVSKAILVSLPLAIIALLFSRTGLRGFVQLMPVAGAVAVVALAGLITLDEWQGRNRVSRWFQVDSQADVLRLYSGGRFRADGDGTIQVALHRVDQGLPFGYGYGDFGIVDNAYFEAAMMGGVFGIVTLAVVLLHQLLFGLKCSRMPEGGLIVLLFAFAILASLGAPTITKNRFSVMFFILFGLSAVFLEKLRNARRSSMTPGMIELDNSESSKIQRRTAEVSPCASDDAVYPRDSRQLAEG